MRLYDYWRSSSAYRVRIALRLKGIDYCKRRSICARASSARWTISRTISRGWCRRWRPSDRTLTQSLAIIEWLDEVHPRAAAAAGDARGARPVRSLALHVACEIQPLNQFAGPAVSGASAGPGGARRQRLVPALDRRGPDLARAPAGRHGRAPIASATRSPGRSVPGAAGLQCAPLQLRPDAVPDDRAHRRRLPEAAGFRRSAAGAAARRRLTRLSRSALASASAAASKGSRTHSWRLLTALHRARTSPARARPGATASPASSRRISAAAAPSPSAEAPASMAPEHRGRGLGQHAAARASARTRRPGRRRAAESIVTRSPHSGLSQVTLTPGAGQPAMAMARLGLGEDRVVVELAVMAHPSAAAGSPRSRPSIRASTSAASL